MNSLDREVVETGGSESTTVTNAAREYPPCIRELVAIAPGNTDHIAIVMRFGLTEPCRYEADSFRSAH